MMPVGVHDTDTVQRTTSACPGSRGAAVAENQRTFLCDACAVETPVLRPHPLTCLRNPSSLICGDVRTLLLGPPQRAGEAGFARRRTRRRGETAGPSKSVPTLHADRLRVAKRRLTCRSSMTLIAACWMPPATTWLQSWAGRSHSRRLRLWDCRWSCCRRSR